MVHQSNSKTKQDKPSLFEAPRNLVQQGFTLIEVMLAVTIMALISIAVINVFRVATDSYKAGNRETQILQRGRYIFDSLEQDLLQVYYLPETSYNVKTREVIEQYQLDLLEAEETNDFEAFEKKYGPIDKKEEKNDPEYVGNPFEEHVLIDLQFFGEDGTDQDIIKFTTANNFEVGARYFKYGLKRVEYKVDGGLLIRTEETIEANKRDFEGIILEKETPPIHTIIASGVEKFDLTYCFWVDNAWFEVDTWQSTGKQLRNSNYILGEYDFEKEGAQSGNQNEDLPQDEAAFGSEGWNESLNDSNQEQFDGLPAYVRVNVVLRDPDDEKSNKLPFSRLFQIPGAVETWVANKKLEEDDRDNEINLRQDEYTEVYPGALKKL